MTPPQELQAVLYRDPEMMHGKLCFKGTRIPLTVLLDNLEEGMGVERGQILAGVPFEQATMRQAVVN